MSLKVYSPRLARLAEVHFGRKREQPARAELRAFYRQARRYLAHDVLWFDDAQRQGVAEAVGDVIRGHRLTCYACAVLSNHVHLLIRKHKLKGQEMHRLFREAAKEKLSANKLVPADHPVFSADVLDVFKSDPRSVQACIAYVEGNFAKHGLVPVKYAFIVPYDRWPFHKRLAE